MPRGGAMVLSDFDPEFRLEIGCAKCDRSGSYRIGSLLMRVGDIGPPDLIHDLSSDCPRRAGQAFGDRCGAAFMNLTAAVRSGSGT